MAAAYAAGAANLPFGVLRGYAGTDLAARTRASRAIDCPFTGEQLAAVPALRPDVGIVHAQQADRQRERPALGDHRRAEGGRARVGAVARDGRGDRRRARAAAGRGRAPVAGRSTAVARGAGRRTPVVRARLLRPRQRLLRRAGTRSAATATRSPRGCDGTCSRRGVDEYRAACAEAPREPATPPTR